MSLSKVDKPGNPPSGFKPERSVLRGKRLKTFQKQFLNSYQSFNCEKHIGVVHLPNMNMFLDMINVVPTAGVKQILFNLSLTEEMDSVMGNTSYLVPKPNASICDQ